MAPYCVVNKNVRYSKTSHSRGSQWCSNNVERVRIEDERESVLKLPVDDVPSSIKKKLSDER